MRIAFYGSSLVSAYWNGAATYYRGIIRNLAELEYEITFFEPDAYGRQQNRDLAEDPEYARVVVYSAEDLDGVSRVLDQARHFDVVVKASGVGVFDELLEREVLERRVADQTVIFWDVDAPATLERITKNPADPFRALIPLYDLIFTYGGGEPVVRSYESYGARKCVPIYNALDPATHFPVDPHPEFDADLSFLGNRLPDREARVDEFFLRAASILPDKRFLLGGAGWGDKPVPSSVRYRGHVYTHEHNAFNCTPRAVLNVSRESMASNGWSPATRVFEAAGAAACLITDAWEGIDHFLEPGKEVLVASNGDEVADIVNNLTIERAREIGSAALRRVSAEHTYAHRARQVDEILKGDTDPRS
ncbi:MAG TPA: glycosyltransferase [Thermoanaerobaculia bacterium]|nr:glycosyltransferase [Thermoanaerobaculia bacterium]